MSDYDNTNTFVLFVNNKKDRTNPDDRSADRTGTLNVDGVEYYMDGWVKQGKNGRFLSGKIKRKQQQAAQPTKPQSTGIAQHDTDGDIPFR